MRRPGILGGYWFGEAKQPKPSMVSQKLEEIRMAKIANSKQLSPLGVTQRISEHLNNPRKLMG